MYMGASPLALALALVAPALAPALVALALLALLALDADELVGQGLLDPQLQQRPAHRPGESFQWLAFLCARGRRRVVRGWVGDCPGQVLLHPLALVEEPLGLLEEALFLLALRVA